MVSFYLYLVYYILVLLFGFVFFGIFVSVELKILLINILVLIGLNWFEVVMMGLFGLFCFLLFCNSVVVVVVFFVVLYGVSIFV